MLDNCIFYVENLLSAIMCVNTMIYSNKREHSMQTGYWRKRNILFVMLVAFVLFSINASAHEYDALITENVPPIGKQSPYMSYMALLLFQFLQRILFRPQRMMKNI